MISFPSFFFLFFFFVPLSCFSSLVTLSGNKTIVSDGQEYECGFFQPDNLTSHWYLGIWLKEDPIRTSLWVANRDNPLTTPNGTLDIIDKELVLVDKDNARVWSAKLSREVDKSRMVAQLEDNGNLVVKSSKHSEEEYSWQSFDTPTDTLLPQMRLGINPNTKNHIVLKSWNSSIDPSSGYFSLGIEDESYEIFVIYLQHPHAENRYRSIVWNGFQFGDMPPILKQLDAPDSFVMTTYQSSKSRLTLTPDGDYEVYMWVQEETTWQLSWSTTQDSCFKDARCGSYGFCSKNTIPRCHCLQGFHPKNDVIESGGCARITAPKCKEDDKFMILKNMKLPENPDDTLHASALEACESLCRRECNCTAFARIKLQNGQNTDHRCITWIGELHDMQNYTVGGQDLHVRLKEPG